MALPAGSQVTIRTRLLPPVVIPVGGGGSSSAVSSAVLAAIQPAVTVTLAGQDLYTFAPAGEPPASSPIGWLLVLGLVVGAGLALYGLVTLWRKKG